MAYSLLFPNHHTYILAPSGGQSQETFTKMENLAKKYKHSKLIKQLRKQMSQACEETYDPIERFWEE